MWKHTQYNLGMSCRTDLLYTVTDKPSKEVISTSFLIAKLFFWAFCEYCVIGKHCIPYQGFILVLVPFGDSSLSLFLLWLMMLSGDVLTIYFFLVLLAWGSDKLGSSWNFSFLLWYHFRIYFGFLTCSALGII